MEDTAPADADFERMADEEAPDGGVEPPGDLAASAMDDPTTLPQDEGDLDAGASLDRSPALEREPATVGGGS